MRRCAAACAAAAAAAAAVLGARPDSHSEPCVLD
jgi:hypothetical protein